MSEPRLLAVHAHADDESITMGGTMAMLRERGARVANVCCTDGRLATIVAADMPEPSTRPRLAEVRRAELTAALDILGGVELHWFGYHDSGMAGAETNSDPEAFFQQPLDGVMARLLTVIREFRPHVVVSYDAFGAYGHPDHIQAHRATLLAVDAAHHGRVHPDAGPPWRVSKLYYVATPISMLRRAIEVAEAAGMPHPFGGQDPETLDFATPDELVTASVDVRPFLDVRRAALLAHHSQIDETFPLVSVPTEVMATVFPTEHYQLALSRVPVSLPETDLFAGVDVTA